VPQPTTSEAMHHALCAAVANSARVLRCQRGREANVHSEHEATAAAAVATAAAIAESWYHGNAVTYMDTFPHDEDAALLSSGEQGDLAGEEASSETSGAGGGGGGGVGGSSSGRSSGGGRGGGRHGDISSGRGGGSGVGECVLRKRGGLGKRSKSIESFGSLIRSESAGGVDDFWSKETVVSKSPVSMIGSPLSKAGLKENELSGLDVLLVEDNQMQVRIVRATVKGSGVAIDSAENGQEALDAVAARIDRGGKMYDVILMDSNMPIKGGAEATQEIRRAEKAHRDSVSAAAQYPTMIIIGLSANTGSDYEREAREAGMDGVLGKPCRPETMRETLKAVFAGTWKRSGGGSFHTE